MGCWYRTFSLRRDVREEVVYRLDGWMLAKGFERWEDPDARFLPPDERGERGAFLLGNDQWTVLAYSEFEEEDRLELELVHLGRPVLRYLVVDSDVWAYQLRVGDEIVSAFASNPGAYSDLPEGPNDLAALCRELELDADPAVLRRLQKRREVFAERAGDAFLAVLGLEAAATQFDYLRDDEIHWRGFELVELRYRRPGFDPMHELDLHRVGELPPERLEPAGAEGEPAPSFEFPVQTRALFALARVYMTLLRPIFWLARPLLRWRARRMLGPRAEGEGATQPSALPIELTQVESGGVFEHRKLGFRLTLGDGIELGGARRLFRWRDVEVGVSIVPASHARAMLAGRATAAEVEKRDLFVGPLPACAWISERREGEEGLRRWLTFFVATRRGVYAFSGHAADRAQPPSRESLWQLAERLSTFELSVLRRAPGN